MSVVTGLVLVCSPSEEMNWVESPPGNVPSISLWLTQHNFQELVELADANATGNKHPQLLLFAAGYNHFPEAEFVEFFNDLQWEYPECVVLILQSEAGPVRVFRPQGLP